MKVRELARLLNARALTGEAGMDNEIQSGYCCDLLSWVMAHGGEGMAWVTVQTHMNVIAVAALHDMSCVGDSRRRGHGGRGVPEGRRGRRRRAFQR